MGIIWDANRCSKAIGKGGAGPDVALPIRTVNGAGRHISSVKVTGFLVLFKIPIAPLNGIRAMQGVRITVLRVLGVVARHSCNRRRRVRATASSFTSVKREL